MRLQHRLFTSHRVKGAQTAVLLAAAITQWRVCSTAHL